MTDRPIAVGLDFGTTNTVISTITPDGVRRRHIFPSPTREGEAAGGNSETTDGFRSLICYWQEVSAGRPSLHHSSGPQGIADYLEWGPDQRLIMSMKSYLADAGFGGTSIFGSRFGIEDIVSDFLSDLFDTLDTPVRGTDARVMVGRPVVFAEAANRMRRWRWSGCGRLLRRPACQRSVSRLNRKRRARGSAATAEADPWFSSAISAAAPAISRSCGTAPTVCGQSRIRAWGLPATGSTGASPII